MFVNRAEWKPFELRQGDILAAIPFPFLSHADVSLLGKIPPGQHASFPAISATLAPFRVPEDINYFTGQLTMRLCPCIVTTQCCELRTNKRNQINEVAAISVCRIVPVKKSILDDAEKLKSLRENRDPRDSQIRSYKNFFWVGTADGLSDIELMVDFSQMACLPNGEFPSIMEKKHAQLTDKDRMKLKIKLGVFVAKPTEEELRDNIAQDPWSSQAASDH